MSSKLYPEQEHEQKKRVRYYKRTEMLSVPQDYFEFIKKSIGDEFKDTYVEKATCLRIYMSTQNIVKALQLQMKQFDERLSLVENIEQIEEPQELITIPEDEAAKRISNFIREKPGSRTSDIICELGLNPDLVLSVLRKLKAEEKITGKNIERT
jgi:hypothetical protein